MSEPLRHMPRPCDPSQVSGACPFRRDADPGEFPAERYEELAATAGRPGEETPIGAPMFACHHTADGAQVACAGWLAVCGHFHLGVRFALATGRLDPSAVYGNRDGWPDLFDTYDEMATAQSGQRAYHHDAAAERRANTGHNTHILDKIKGGGQCPQ